MEFKCFTKSTFFHFCITNCHTDKIINSFVEDIKSSIQNVREKIDNCEENTKIVSRVCTVQHRK